LELEPARSIPHPIHRKSFNNPAVEVGAMKVQDVMTSEVKSCRPETNLAEAAAMML
jgi:CBS domain-containing protein